jgi:hypothetical protein
MHCLSSGAFDLILRVAVCGRSRAATWHGLPAREPWPGWPCHLATATALARAASPSRGRLGHISEGLLFLQEQAVDVNVVGRKVVRDASGLSRSSPTTNPAPHGQQAGRGTPLRVWHKRPRLCCVSQPRAPARRPAGGAGPHFRGAAIPSRTGGRRELRRARSGP